MPPTPHASQRLAGHSALISGGASGCGAAAARLFAAEGARVTIVDRQAELGAALAAELQAAGLQASFAQADVSQRDQVEAAVAHASTTFGAPTVLFNHAGAIAVEFRDRNIRCNAVCPGFIETPHGLREVEALTRYGVDVSEAAIRAAQGRMCRPEEVASAALFLASDDASFVNGTHLFVDNGFTAV